MDNNDKGIVVCALVLILLITSGIVYEVLNSSQLDQTKTSIPTETTCKRNKTDSVFTFDCEVKYPFEYQEKSYTCIAENLSMTKKEYKDKEKVYFSSGNPNNCSVGVRSKHIPELLTINSILIVIMGIHIRRMRKGRG